MNRRRLPDWTASAFAYYWTRTAEAWSMSADAPAWLRKRHRMVKANRTDRRGATGALTFHELRHTFATILLESGMPHTQVALQLPEAAICAQNRGRPLRPTRVVAGLRGGLRVG